MDTTKVRMHGFEINIRTSMGYQDIDVISECLGGDCYGLSELSKRLTPNIVLDVGGHIGAFGLSVKRLWPDCNLIAVEPCKESAELYEMNLRDNGFKGTVINKAISYAPKRTKLIHSSRTTGGHVLLSSDEISGYAEMRYRTYGSVVEDVECITIDEITKGIDVIDIAKLDCEGAEVDALRKISDESAAKFRTVVGEYHLWGDGRKLLQASPLDELAFWRDVRRKFPHLLWSWTGTVDIVNKYGKFQAWPKAH